MDNKNNLLDQILDKVTDIKADTNSLKDRLTEIEKSKAALNQKVEGIDKRLGNLETRINTFEGKLPDITNPISALFYWTSYQLKGMPAKKSKSKNHSK